MHPIKLSIKREWGPGGEGEGEKIGVYGGEGWGQLGSNHSAGIIITHLAD